MGERIRREKKIEIEKRGGTRKGAVAVGQRSSITERDEEPTAGALSMRMLAWPFFFFFGIRRRVSFFFREKVNNQIFPSPRKNYGYSMA